MSDACEALRLLGDDGVIDGENAGRLYRTSMEKKGIWDGVPLEYARLLTDWPGKNGWNGEWERPRAVKVLKKREVQEEVPPSKI
jgi:large subunit ribosomal protein L40